MHKRLGIKPTRNVLTTIVNDILRGRAVVLEFQKSGPDRVMYRVDICGRHARVVFSHADNVIAAFMRMGVTV